MTVAVARATMVRVTTWIMNVAMVTTVVMNMVIVTMMTATMATMAWPRAEFG